MMKHGIGWAMKQVKMGKKVRFDSWPTHYRWIEAVFNDNIVVKFLLVKWCNSNTQDGSKVISQEWTPDCYTLTEMKWRKVV